MSHRLTVIVSSVALVLIFAFVTGTYFGLAEPFVTAQTTVSDPIEVTTELEITPLPPFDTEAYDLKLRELAQLVEGEEAGLWPAEAVYPNAGALLPFHRIVAYYGNFYSKGMGVLGQYSKDEVIRRLNIEIEKWNLADPTTPVVPAIDYIAVVAQAGAGADRMYRARMPDSQIDKALALAEEIDGIVILEVQAGLSDVLVEVKNLEKYLVFPNVHLAIDPEFAMKKSGRRPGSAVGTVDATDVNAAAQYLASLVVANDLPPKLMVVHRYTRAMVTNADKIDPLPEVQIIIDMDGWGSNGAKYATYNAYIAPEPVQFTGFKLFYYNDAARVGSRLLTPAEILDLTPKPSFIQYQ